MKVIYNNLIPFPGYMAMMLFGVIFARKKHKPLSKQTINHESIHHAQAKEFGYISYYFHYLYYWLKVGYGKNPFEREAYLNEGDLSYLETRQKGAWREYDRKTTIRS